MPATSDKFGDWSDGGVFTVLALNVIVFTIIILVFSFLRRSKKNDPVLSARATRLLPIQTRVAVPGTPHIVKPEGFFGWLPQILRMSDSEVMRQCGLEASLLVMFERSVLGLFLLVSLVTAPILVPIHNSKKNNLKIAQQLIAEWKEGDPEVVYTTGFNNWTVRNVERGDAIVWVHLVVFVIISLAIYVLAARVSLALYAQRKEFARLRANVARVADEYTVLIRGIPPAVTTPGPIKEVLEAHYPGQVLAVHLIAHLPDVLKMKQEKKEAQAKLDHFKALVHENPQADTMVKAGGLVPLCCGTKVEAISHYTSLIAELDKNISKILATKNHPLTGAAFVTFRTTVTARRCAQNFAHKFDVVSLQATDPKAAVPTALDKVLFALGVKTPPPKGHVQGFWRVSLASPPSQVLWNNLVISEVSQSIRMVIFGVITCGLILFWAIPVSFLGSLSSLSSIPGLGNSFKKLNDLPPVILSFLGTYLPVIVMIVFNVFLPVILTKIATLEGAVTAKDLHRRVLVKFYTFILFSVVILPAVFIGAIANLANLGAEFSSSPFSALMELLKSITSPATGQFVGYVTQLSLIGSSLLLLSLGPLIVGHLKHSLSKTERSKRESYLLSLFPYHLRYPTILLVMSIGLLFSITMPITTPFVTVFFSTSYVVDKYRLVHMSATSDNEGGFSVVTVVRIILVIQLVFQIASLSLFLSLSAYGQLGITALFIIITIVIMVKQEVLGEKIFMDDLFVEPQNGESEKEIDENSAIAYSYIHPAYVVQTEEEYIERYEEGALSLATERDRRNAHVKVGKGESRPRTSSSTRSRSRGASSSSSSTSSNSSGDSYGTFSTSSLSSYSYLSPNDDSYSLSLSLSEYSSDPFYV